METRNWVAGWATDSVLYCVRDVGGFAGSSLSPFDWLQTLASLGIPTTLVTRSSPDVLPATIDLGTHLRWKMIEKQHMSKLRRRNRALGFARSLWPGPSSGLPRRPVIVEGRNGFRFGVRLGLIGDQSTALVVRGQPSQYDSELAGDDRLSNMQAALDHCDTVIFNAHRVRESWRSVVDLEDKRTLIVANTAPEEEIQEIRERSRESTRRNLGLDPDALVVLCLASIQRRKGQDLLLDVWPEIQAQVPNAQLHLVGPTAKRGGGEELVERAKTMPGVVVAGARRDALLYLYASDILVLPSRGESMPRVVLEAMALGTPVVATGAGAVPEMIEHGTTGMLFDVDEPRGARDAIIALARSVSMRREMAERSLTSYWQRYSRKNQRQQLRRVVDTLWSR